MLLQSGALTHVKHEIKYLGEVLTVYNADFELAEVNPNFPNDPSNPQLIGQQDTGLRMAYLFVIKIFQTCK